jgi:DNA-binding CsgD family transcriptional regulator
MFRQTGDQAMIASVLTHLGFTFVLQGDLERATATSQEAAAMLREQKHTSYLADALYNLGWAALLRGDSERARALYAESMRMHLEVDDKLLVPDTLLGLACVAEARGEAERAARLFGACEALREAVGSPFTSEEEALKEPYLGAARSQLDEVAWEAAFAEGRAMELEEAVEYALSEDDSSMIASRTPEQTSTTAHPPALTRREREVAKLVARGLTNRQIAEELVLSERTVENHVSNILKKLKLSSRSEVAAWVEAL